MLLCECDPTEQERFADSQSDREAHAIFHTHGWPDVWIKCCGRPPELWEKGKLLLLVRKVLAKDNKCAINITIALLGTTLGKAQSVSRCLTCYQLVVVIQKNIRHKNRICSNMLLLNKLCLLIVVRLVL